MTWTMSQPSQSVRLCMPLTKFSYANVQAGSIGPIPWTHLPSRGDLYVVIDPFEIANNTGTTEQRYKFKVLQDPNAHEDLDLSLLANEAKRAAEEVRNSSFMGQQPSVTVIVRVPCVAMRYPLANGQVRRFQVRFTRDEDFYETLKVFSIAKVPFIEAGAAPNQPPVVAPTPAFALPNSNSYNTNVQGDSKGAIQSFESNPQGPGTMQIACQPSSQKAADSVGTIMGTIIGSNQCSIQKEMIQPIQSTTASGGTDRPSITSLPLLTNDATSLSFASDHRDHSALGANYIPRPSTAPEVTGGNSDIYLPPKRDLPFQRKVRSKPVPSGSTESALLCTENQTHVPTEDVTMAHTELQVQGHDPEVKVKKKAAPRTRKAPATKSQKAPTRKRGSASQSQDTPVPSVEDLLRCSDDLAQMDTQALLKKAGEIQEARKANQEPNRQQDSIPGTKDSLPAQLPQDNIHHKPYNLRGKSSAKAHLNNSQPQPPTNPTLPTSDPANTPIPHQNPNPNIQDPQPQSQSHSHDSTLLSLLLSDPNFAQPAITSPASTKITDLSPQEQHQLYEDFIVQTLEDDNFIQLCKTLEGVWQRIFVKI